jgi:hypothetical protein
MGNDKEAQMNKMYKELFCKMKMRKLSQGEVAQQIGISRKALYNKIFGISDFTATEMFTLRDKFFPNETLDDLFTK